MEEKENPKNTKSQSLKTNSLFYLIYNVLNVIFPFITGIYVARVLLPDGIGQVETARNLVSYFSILAFIGIPTYGLREIAKARNDQNKLNKLFSELFIINSISTTIFGALYLALIFAVPNYRENWPLYLITGITVFINFFNVSWLYEGLEEFKFISIRNIIFKILTFCLLIALVRKQDDYLMYAIIAVVGTTGNYILDLVLSPRKVKFTTKGLNLRQHVKSLLYLATVNLAIELYMLVDVTMLGWMTDNETVAFYSYGIKIHRILLSIVNTFTIVLVPRISLYYKAGNIEDYNRLITKTLRIICLIAIPAIIGIWFVADILLVLIYGDAYIQSAYILKILSFNLLISPIGYLLGSRVMLVTGGEKLMIIPVTAGALVNIILNIILIHFYSHIGAAIASVVSEIVVLVVYLIISHKKFKLTNTFKPSIIKTLISAAVMTGILVGTLFIPVSTWIKTIIQIVLGILSYGLMLIILKEDIVTKIFKRGND